VIAQRKNTENSQKYWKKSKQKKVEEKLKKRAERRGEEYARNATKDVFQEWESQAPQHEILHKNVTNASCPDFQIEWRDDFSEKYRLRKDRFLVPALTYGPNNQLRGFRESVLLAIFTNRSLVMPPFFKHNRNDPTLESHDTVVSPAVRINPEKLQSFLTVSNGSDASAICNGTMNVAFLSGRQFCKFGRLAAINEFISFPSVHGQAKSYFHEGKKCSLSIPVLPQMDPNSKQNSLRYDLSLDDLDSLKTIQSNFNSTEPCAIWLFPYLNIDFSHLNDRGALRQTKRNSTTFRLLKDLYDATPRPIFVQQASRTFIANEMAGRSYVAIHWRYSKDDWFKHCTEVRLNKKDKYSKRMQCEVAMRFSRIPEVTADILADFVQSPETGNVSAIYFAAPPTEMEYILSVRRKLRERKVEVYTAHEMISFLETNWADCDQFLENKFDILSLIEQEICSKSNIFLRAQGSSWSANIHAERILANVEQKDQKNIMFFEERFRVLHQMNTSTSQDHLDDHL